MMKAVLSAKCAVRKQRGVEAQYIDTAKAEVMADNPWSNGQKKRAADISTRALCSVLLKIACGQAIFIKGMADINMILMHRCIDI